MSELVALQPPNSRFAADGLLAFARIPQLKPDTLGACLEQCDDTTA